LPTQVSVNNQGIQGLNTSTNVITFAATGVYEFLFETSDNGATFIVSEVNKRIQPFNNSSEDLAASGAANLAVSTSYFSTAAAETATLAAGVNGQIKTFAMYADSGDMVITVTNAGWKTLESGTGTITFDTIGDACTLQYINAKWFCIGNNGCVFA
jgi:cytoskeletal protein RodZ